MPAPFPLLAVLAAARAKATYSATNAARAAASTLGVGSAPAGVRRVLLRGAMSFSL